MTDFTFYVPVFIAFIGAILLSLHHYYEHRDKENPKNTKAQSESCSYICFLQISDISNHETWIIALLVFGVSWVLCLQMCNQNCNK